MKNRNKYNVRDHKGYVYNSRTEMCQEYGIEEIVYMKRIEAGWPQEEALVTPKGQVRSWKAVSDHCGNQFPNTQAMCDHWGINRKTYIYRVSNGMSIEEALTIPTDHVFKTDKYKCTDHLGNTHESARAMCDHYKVKFNTYSARRKRGYSIEEALLGKAKVPFYDEAGSKYNSFSDCCRKHGISQRTVRSRMASGMSLTEALSKEVNPPQFIQDYQRGVRRMAKNGDTVKIISCSDGDHLKLFCDDNNTVSFCDAEQWYKLPVA